ncbi:MAG: PilZ domain-containing protein [Treponema sp.]|nr:PilZ domain-containing protein [Treponema sp.]
MAIVTSQQLTHYYDYYRTTEIIFTKDIIKVLSMDPRQIYVKCTGSQWPCILNSTSFQAARIIVGTKGDAFKQLAQRDAPAVNIRYYFRKQDGQELAFFVAGKVVAISSYMNSRDLAIITIQYTQRPPDAFIEMLGHLIDANENAIRRKEERILVNQETCRRLRMKQEESVILVEGVPRRCIIRDLSFGGAKVMVLGLAQFLVGKTVQLNLEFTDPSEVLNMEGKIIKAIPVEGRKDIFAVSIKFGETAAALSYKIHINAYLSSLRKDELENKVKQEELAQQRALEEQKIKEQRALAIQKSQEEEAKRMEEAKRLEEARRQEEAKRLEEARKQEEAKRLEEAAKNSQTALGGA